MFYLFQICDAPKKDIIETYFDIVLKLKRNKNFILHFVAKMLWN